MALRLAFVLLFSIAAFGLGNAIPAYPTQKCGANAEFRACGSACEPTCANPKPGPICTLQCVIGCFCKEGFLMNSQGECVRPTECDAAPAPTVQPIAIELHRDRRPVRCAVNEEFKECKGCDSTCFNSNVPCPRICKPGCACKEGHVRADVDGLGQCVPRNQCPIIDPPVMIEVQAAVDPVDGKCAANEVFQACGSACAPTCQNPTPSAICTKNCVIGCYCQEGFLRNHFGVCVPTRECFPSEAPIAAAMPVLPQCPANEFFNPCGSACAPTCKNPNPSPVCTRQCVPACFCREGMLRTEKGECVQQHQCNNDAAASFDSLIALPPDHQKCGANEEFSTCGSFCAPTCAVRQPKHCTLRCKVGCFCKKGFFKNAQGVCVPEVECEQPSTSAPIEASAPVNKCPTENEIYHECGVQLNCLSSCTFKHTPECMQRMCTAGCVCKKPFVRHDDGRCVEMKECPNTPPFLLGADGH